MDGGVLTPRQASDAASADRLGHRLGEAAGTSAAGADAQPQLFAVGAAAFLERVGDQVDLAIESIAEYSPPIPAPGEEAKA